MYHLKITGIFYHDDWSVTNIGCSGYGPITIVSNTLNLLNMGSTDTNFQANNITISDKGRFYMFTAPIYLMCEFTGDFYVRFRRHFNNTFLVATDSPVMLIHLEAIQIHEEPPRP
jgi:hypothetical protein